jgi:hypothetical protein
MRAPALPLSPGCDTAAGDAAPRASKEHSRRSRARLCSPLQKRGLSTGADASTVTLVRTTLFFAALLLAVGGGVLYLVAGTDVAYWVGSLAVFPLLGIVYSIHAGSSTAALREGDVPAPLPPSRGFGAPPPSDFGFVFGIFDRAARTETMYGPPKLVRLRRPRCDLATRTISAAQATTMAISMRTATDDPGGHTPEYERHSGCP